jgi:hypothetical protein
VGCCRTWANLDLQRDLESCAGGQPEVVPGLDPVGGPLLKSDFTATGIAPESVANFELDLRFSAFRVHEPPLCLAVRFAGRIAVAHLVTDDRSRAPGLVSLLKLAAFDVRHGLTNPSGREGGLRLQPFLNCRAAVADVTADPIPDRSIPRCRQPYSVSIGTPSISDNSGRVISGSVDFLPVIIFLSPPDASVVRRSKPAIEPCLYQALDSSYLVAC